MNPSARNAPNGISTILTWAKKYGYSPEELEEEFAALGEPKFRAGQVFQWISRGVRDFDKMTNLSKPLREKLDAAADAETKNHLMLALRFGLAAMENAEEPRG